MVLPLVFWRTQKPTAQEPQMEFMDGLDIIILIFGLIQKISYMVYLCQDLENLILAYQIT